MMYKPRITVEIDGIERVQTLIGMAHKQMEELEFTIQRMRAETLEIQAKINQPPVAADD